MSKEVARGDINGIVYLCSYGYHSLRETNYQNHDLFVKGDTPAQFLKTYRQACLEAELRAFKDYLIPVLEHHENPPWVLFLISKQDLWWTKRDEVKGYYQKNGAFHLALQKMLNKQGYENLKVEFCEVCFRAENLETKNGTVLAATNKGYTDQERISNIQNVLKVALLHDSSLIPISGV